MRKKLGLIERIERIKRDEASLSFAEFLKKYYAKDSEYSNLDAGYKEWYFQYDFFVKPLFDGTTKEQYEKSMRAAMASFFPEKELIDEFWAYIKDDTRFDLELKHMFTFLYSINFYEGIEFEQWLRIDYWNAPGIPDIEEKEHPILEILSYEHGIDYLKIRLGFLGIFQIIGKWG